MAKKVSPETKVRHIRQRPAVDVQLKSKSAMLDLQWGEKHTI
jgi:hypothetical protein